MKQQRVTVSVVMLGLLVGLLTVPPLHREANWLMTTLRDSQDAYVAYLTAWPASPYADEARVREDDRAWQAAERTGTLPAYHDYLAAHPTGRYVAEAHLRVDDLTWAAALAAHSVPAIEQYLRRFPTGRHPDEARVVLEEVHWQGALASDAVEASLAYVARYPAGRFRAAAVGRIDDLRWMRATGEDTLGAYQGYLREEPRGRYRDPANARIEDLSWEAAVRTGTRDAFESVLARWPGGRYVEAARARIDDLQWRAAVARGTLRAYREYLRTAERGRHAAEARARIAALPAPLPNMAYAGQTDRDGTVRLVIGPNSALTAARISLYGIDQPSLPSCGRALWWDDPRYGLSFLEYPDVPITADDLPLPIRNGRIAYVPNRPRTVSAVISDGLPAISVGANPLPAGLPVIMQLVQVAVRGEFHADRLEGTIQPVFPGLPDCDGPAIPFSAVAIER